MRTIETLFHLALADFRDRVRRFSFLILVLATGSLGYLFVPPADAQYQTLSFGDIRGIYNSPWVGAMFGVMISTLVALIAFYPLKNAVERDRQTRVGQIIAITPMRKPVYVLGKWLSNLALLVVLTAVMTAMAIAMQLVRAEETALHLWNLVVPLWAIGFPTLALVSAVAVIFECIPWLRGTWGNIVYFFLYMGVLIWTMEGMMEVSGDRVVPANDPFGISHVLSDMQRVVAQNDPNYSGALIIGGATFTETPRLFTWTGMHWADLIPGRLIWLGVAAGLATAAALPFDRFDPARRRLRRRRRGRDSGGMDEPLASDRVEIRAQSVILTPLTARANRWRPLGILVAELRLALKGLPWWWYVAMLALVVTQGVFEREIASMLLLVAWLLPVSIWSAMGTRESRHQTGALVLSVAHPLRRQFFASWLAGVIVALLAGSSTVVRLLAGGDPGRASAVLVGALFVPSLALALGVWSSTPRLFEVTYLILWYIAMNGAEALDFTGTVAAVWQPEITLAYLGASGTLLVLALIGRWRQMSG